MDLKEMEIPKPEKLSEYLNPVNFTGRLVELPAGLNPLADQNVTIYAKIVWGNPILNGKLFPAYWMLKKAEEEGRLKGINTLVEATSGNMAVALAILARIFGIEHLIAIVPPNIARGKLSLLKFYGVEVVVADNGIALAKQMGSQPGRLNLWQYGNGDNPNGYYQFLAANIWEQTARQMTVFAAGLGTTGTIQGIARYLREQKAKTLVLGVITASGETIPGVRTDERLKEVDFDWRDLVDDTEHVGKDTAMRSSLGLSRIGIAAGPSSGFALAGLRQFLDRRRAAGTLDQLRNDAGKVEAVFVCFDTPLPYLEDFDHYI